MVQIQPAVNTHITQPQSNTKPQQTNNHSADPPPGIARDQIKMSVPLGKGLFAIVPANGHPASSADVQSVTNLIEADKNREVKTKSRDNDPLTLRENYGSIFRTQSNPDEAKGTVVMFHGYTAGPYQYAELSDRFFAAGYNVYSPLMPGHGYMNDEKMGTGINLPKANELERYENFVNTSYAKAASLGAPISVVGLSGGGNLAIRMAEKYPDLHRVVAMAPYVGPNKDDKEGIFASALVSLNKLTLGAVGHVMDRFPYNENELEDPSDDTPHTQGSLSQAQAMFTFGANVQKVIVPTQFFTTQGDQLSGTKTVEALYEKSGGAAAKHGIVDFTSTEQVPHAMLSPLENKAPNNQVQNLHEMTFEVIDSNKMFYRPENDSSYGTHYVNQPLVLKPAGIVRE